MAAIQSAHHGGMENMPTGLEEELTSLCLHGQVLVGCLGRTMFHKGVA
jgi:hypothetical protein